jgi:hypothetical protein
MILTNIGKQACLGAMTSDTNQEGPKLQEYLEVSHDDALVGAVVYK